MRSPSSDHPLPWIKRVTSMRDTWSIEAANGQTVAIMFDEATADFIVAKANASISSMHEIDNARVTAQHSQTP